MAGDPPRSPPRKRPGASSRVSAAAKQAAEQRRQERLEAERKLVQERGAEEVVAAHYNAVPERGRDWRKTESQIKGLRSLNNWIKGDLAKWQKAPQMPRLYVGVDPADVSIDQARDRYNEMSRRRKGPRGPPQRIYEAHFFAQDAFGKSLVNIPIVRQVGFDPHAGPEAVIQGRPSMGGFDVVSMMFCLHYSFEAEEKARGMLANVAGALKKGGRFLGVMPNSDVISSKVEQHFGKAKKDKTPNDATNDEDDDNWDPENSLESPQPAQNGTMEGGGADDDGDDWDPEKTVDAGDDDDEWDPEKTLDATEDAAEDTAKDDGTSKKEPSKPTGEQAPLEWGNSIYTVKFPQTRPLPKDGVFRPPYGWKYFYYLEEAVDVPEYVVPWEGFRALAEDYGLSLLYRKPFNQIWEEEKDDPVLGQLSERMGVKDRSGRPTFGPEDMEAASFYHAFCFYKI
ncbi:mRNA cap guanine-N7 methyltransferase [Taxawa tesnikishii (nom. ined.)]|nr:mRNA cap guanine-N7 methyltransferase [Dothideales sp. JES 119]